MAATRKKKPNTNDLSETEITKDKKDSPLIFISHDTRDAELAEKFSELLTNASAGALESFRSSDKKGTQGIEYGLDWYPAIMDKIDEATDVVCLLTKRSVERPWILYEAGVAKGKLGKKVVGVAMGIKHSVAFTGPFAQFQNNDGSVEAINKLVLELVGKVPTIKPNHSHVEQLVQSFHKTASEIVKRDLKEADTPETGDEIVAKLFEEVKIRFESIPSRIEERMDPEFRRRRRRFHPMIFEELMHEPDDLEDPFGILIAASLVKNDIPWIYELARATFKAIEAGNLKEMQTQLNRIHRFSKGMMREFMMDEMGFRGKEFHIFIHEFPHMLERQLMYAMDHKRSRMPKNRERAITEEVKEKT